MTITRSFEVERLLVEFEVDGHAVPHAFEMAFVPHKDWRSDRSGNVGRYAPKPNPRLMGWQDKIRKSARVAMGNSKPFERPVMVEFVFTCRPRGGEPYGSPMTTPVKGNGSKQDPTMADLDNLVKAAQDGLAGVVLANDVVALLGWQRSRRLTFVGDDVR
jgi:hypothetical protein